jgi:hypothetical protein
MEAEDADGGDLGTLSGLSLDERFLAESGLLGEQEGESSRGGAAEGGWAELAAFKGDGASALDSMMDFEVADDTPLRCIDAGHPADCTRCVAARACVRAARL